MAAPIARLLKDNGSVRICGDYKQTIHQSSLCDKCPVPKTEDLLVTLHGGEKFFKLDRSHAYHQLVLSLESFPLLTVIFFKKLLFGCPTGNFGPLSGGQPHSPYANHCILHISPESHQEPRDEIGSLSPAKCIVGFET